MAESGLGARRRACFALLALAPRRATPPAPKRGGFLAAATPKNGRAGLRSRLRMVGAMASSIIKAGMFMSQAQRCTQNWQHDTAHSLEEMGR